MKPTQNISARRDQITIMGDLLTNTIEPKRVTHLLYCSNMGYSQLIKYLDTLIGLDLIVVQTKPFKSFTITEKGKSFLSIIKKIKSINDSDNVS